MKHILFILIILFSSSIYSQTDTMIVKYVLESGQNTHQKQNFAKGFYNKNSSKMGKKTVRFLDNKVYVAKNNGNALFINLEYILDEISFNGKRFRNVNIQTQPFFKNMLRAYSKSDKIVIVFNSKGRMVNAVFKNGLKDVARNTNDLTITITDSDIRLATLSVIKYFIENPYYKEN